MKTKNYLFLLALIVFVHCEIKSQSSSTATKDIALSKDHQIDIDSISTSYLSIRKNTLKRLDDALREFYDFKFYKSLPEDVKKKLEIKNSGKMISEIINKAIEMKFESAVEAIPVIGGYAKDAYKIYSDAKELDAFIKSFAEAEETKRQIDMANDLLDVLKITRDNVQSLESKIDNDYKKTVIDFFTKTIKAQKDEGEREILLTNFKSILKLMETELKSDDYDTNGNARLKVKSYFMRKIFESLATNFHYQEIAASGKTSSGNTMAKDGLIQFYIKTTGCYYAKGWPDNKDECVIIKEYMYRFVGSLGDYFTKAFNDIISYNPKFEDGSKLKFRHFNMPMLTRIYVCDDDEQYFVLHGMANSGEYNKSNIFYNIEAQNSTFAKIIFTELAAYPSIVYISPKPLFGYILKQTLDQKITIAAGTKLDNLALKVTIPK